ncbi:hypothetical protein PTKIN_Ptkin02bG0083400 [Pterospermum kingtungense]
MTKLLSATRVQSFQSIREEEALNLIESIRANGTRLPVNLSDKVFSMTYAITARAAFAFHRVSNQMHKLEKNHQEAGRILGNIVTEHKESRARAKGTTTSKLSYWTFSGGSETSSTVVEWAMSEMTMASSADSKGSWFLPDVLVNVQKSGDETLGVIQKVLSVALGSNCSGNTVIAQPSEMEIIPPRKSDKIKIMGCSLRGFTGKLIGVDATDGI